MTRMYLDPLKERLDSGLPLEPADCERLIRRIKELENVSEQLAEANARIQELDAGIGALERQVQILKSGGDGWAASAADVIAEKLAVPASEVERIAALIRREWESGLRSSLLGGRG
jgi:hypothetical protein